MDCERIDLLVGLAEGKLDDAERREVESHLGACSTCQEFLAGYATIEADLGQLEQPEPSVEARAKAYSAVLLAMETAAPAAPEAADAPPNLESSPRGSLIVFARIVAAAACFMLVAALLLAPEEHANVASGDPRESRTISPDDVPQAGGLERSEPKSEPSQGVPRVEEAQDTREHELGKDLAQDELAAGRLAARADAALELAKVLEDEAFEDDDERKSPDSGEGSGSNERRLGPTEGERGRLADGELVPVPTLETLQRLAEKKRSDRPHKARTCFACAEPIESDWTQCKFCGQALDRLERPGDYARRVLELEADRLPEVSAEGAKSRSASKAPRRGPTAEDFGDADGSRPPEPLSPAPPSPELAPIPPRPADSRGALAGRAPAGESKAAGAAGAADKKAGGDAAIAQAVWRVRSGAGERVYVLHADGSLRYGELAQVDRKAERDGQAQLEAEPEAEPEEGQAKKKKADELPKKGAGSRSGFGAPGKDAARQKATFEGKPKVTQVALGAPEGRQAVIAADAADLRIADELLAILSLELNAPPAARPKRASKGQGKKKRGRAPAQSPAPLEPAQRERVVALFRALGVAELRPTEGRSAFGYRLDRLRDAHRLQGAEAELKLERLRRSQSR